MEKGLENTELHENKMGTEPVLLLLIKMALPAMLSMLVQSLYNVVDSIFVSRLGEEALRAVTMAFPIQQLMIALFVGTSIGINSLIARSLGMKKQERADSAAKHSVILGFLNGLFFAILGLVIARTYYGRFTDNASVLENGVTYLRIVTIASFGLSLEINLEKTIQATGNMITPMVTQMLGAVTNIILDPILIFGLFGLPAYGVKGAALATVIGQLVAMFYAFYALFIKPNALNLKGKFVFDFSIVADIFRVGFPSIVMTSIASFMVMFMNSILKPFSEVAITVLGNYFRLQSFIFMPIFGLTQGAMPIMGYNYGAGEKERLMSALKYGVIIAATIMLVGTSIFWFFPKELLSIFKATPEMYEIGIPAFKTIALCFVFAGVSIMISVTFQAIGMGFNSLALSVIRQLMLIIPLFYYFSTISLDLVWYAFPLAEIVCMILSIALFRWIYKKRIANMVPIGNEKLNI